MRSERWWSVGLVVASSEATALHANNSAMMMYSGDVRTLRLAGLNSDEEDIASIGFELRAVSAEAAEGRAQNLASQARKAAKLSQAPLPVAWVFPLRDEVESSGRFLDEARHLIGESHFEMGVIAAHIHLELQVKTSLETAAEKDGPGWARILMETRGVGSLANRQTQMLVEELLGLEIGGLKQWPEYREHVARRNAIVHDGQKVRAREAGESIAVVEAMVGHLAQASRQL